ncbi:PhoX family protein [Sphingomonas profundi]|uniref:PhoX family protein n=1 Tax=Alterirhizorhabdus profundi TaxID=2681549 RepID=UPI0012E828B2|nr:PhoX family phosphatase [Sphingomonas profundi]
MADIADIAGYTDGDIDTNRSDNPSLEDIVAARYSRRQTMLGGVTALTTAVFGGSLLSACGGENNDAPVVTAGQTAQSASGRIVTLAGTATDDKAVSSVAWTQISGPTVTLTGAATNNATFLAPSVSASTPLVFRFSAMDEKGKMATADTTVTVDPATLGFTALPKSLDDIVKVPSGYTVTVLYRLGDPINTTTPAFVNDGTDTTFSARAGDHHDGMSFFGLAATGSTPDLSSSTRGVLVLNHENITQRYLHPNGPTTLAGGARPEGEALKEMECHGVSAIEVTRATSGAWSYVNSSTLNRRITPLTPTVFNGPVRGNGAIRTRFSPDGTAGRGTINNCANGYMPWGTYATNEENWAGYFRRDTGDAAARGGVSAKASASLIRYGITEGRAGNYGWATVTPADASSTIYSRWNITATAALPADGTGDFRNEAFQFGWVVEIDPFDPTKAPRKRTALGRMNHEGCWPSNVVVGRKPAFYMGDDAQNEYLYKFVSNTAWVAADATATDRLAIGDKYLDAGTLYVARFNQDGTGTWLPLVFGQNGLTTASNIYPFADQGDVLINARFAADALGATKMDRPEWTAVNPKSGEMYLTLTNNSSRTFAGTDAANPRYYNDPKGTTAQRGNPNGHVIRLRETGDTSEAVTFTWDIYAFGAGSDLDATNINVSGLTADNDFSSPDGLWFARPSNASGLVNPLLWIETDDGAYTDQTNCMLLAAVPGTVGDGGARTITNTSQDGTATRTQATFVGKAPGTNLRRFLVGPKECEITGIDTTPDGRSLFVNIQHPGENGSPAAISSNWPANQGGTAAPTARPRSATIVITKNDGGIVGL